MYAKGVGVPQDDVMAYAWVNVAAASGREEEKETRVSEGRRWVADG